MSELEYTPEELATLGFTPPTEEEIDAMVLDLEVTMSNMVQYSGSASGCSCKSDGGSSCNK